MVGRARPRRSRCVSLPQEQSEGAYCSVWIGRIVRKMEEAQAAHDETCEECKSQNEQKGQEQQAAYVTQKKRNIQGYA